MRLRYSPNGLNGFGLVDPGMNRKIPVDAV
jgi:hypothetical protein